MLNFRKCCVEFIGTYFLVLTIGCMSTLTSSGIIAPIVIGFILMVMVYAGGYISGGHYNPAVSLAAVIRGALSADKLLPYMLAQFLGGFGAALTVNYLADGPSVPSPTGFFVPALIIGEFLFTFALCYVVLLTATGEKVKGNSYYGLAIGSTVLVGAAAVGGTICMGAFNPAVALAATVMSGCCLKIALVTILTNLIAGAVAAFMYKLLNN